MIKINLNGKAIKTGNLSFGTGIGIELGEGGEPTSEAKKDLLIKGLLLFIGPIALILYESSNIPDKNIELNNKTQMVQELRAYNEKAAASVAEIKKFKEDEILIEARIKALEKISRDRLREIKILDFMQDVIPEKAWLTDLKIDLEKLEIKGLAMSDAEVSSILESLTRSVLFLNVKPISSTEINQDGVTLKKFEISCILEKTDE